MKMKNNEIETSEKKPKALRKVKYGSMAVITIAIVVAIVVVINVMASVMEKRTPLKIDLTADKRYDLSDETVDVIKNLNNDLDILVTMPKSDFNTYSEYYERMIMAYYGMNLEFPYDMIPVILEKYEMYSKQGGNGKINVRYVDLNNDPDAISQYSDNYNGEITKSNIVFSSGDKVKVLSETDIINMIQFDQSTLQSNAPSLVFAGESNITSEIMNVTDSHIVNVAFVKTMNDQSVYRTDYEKQVGVLENTLLAKNGYECTDIDIAKDELDTEKYDLIVIPMPQYDFTEAIIEKLQDFMYNNQKYGKNMIYIPDLASTNLNNIDEFLADWNIQVENRIIGDVYYAMGNSSTNIQLSINDSDSVGYIPNSALPIVAPYSREITLLTKNNDNELTSVLKSSAMSYISNVLTEGEQVSEEIGARDVVALSKRTYQSIEDQFETTSSSVLVIGSSMMFDEELITQTSTYNNANVLLNIFNTMTGKENGVVIPEKALQRAVIAPTAKQDKGIKVAIIVIPVLVAAVGLVVLIRRRNR